MLNSANQHRDQVRCTGPRNRTGSNTSQTLVTEELSCGWFSWWGPEVHGLSELGAPAMWRCEMWRCGDSKTVVNLSPRGLSACDASCLTITHQTFILYDGGERVNWGIQHEH